MDREGYIQKRVVVIAMDGSKEADSALQCKIFVYFSYLYTYNVYHIYFLNVLLNTTFLNVNVK